MKEYTYEAEHSWETQRRPVVVDHHHRQRQQAQQQHHPRQPNLGGGVADDAAMDADASSMSGTYERLSCDASRHVYFKFNTKQKNRRERVSRSNGDAPTTVLLSARIQRL